MQDMVGKLTIENLKLQHKVRKPCLIFLKQIPINQLLLPPSRLCHPDVKLLNKAESGMVNWLVSQHGFKFSDDVIVGFLTRSPNKVNFVLCALIRVFKIVSQIWRPMFATLVRSWQEFGWAPEANLCVMGCYVHCIFSWESLCCRISGNVCSHIMTFLPDMKKFCS